MVRQRIRNVHIFLVCGDIPADRDRVELAELFKDLVVFEVKPDNVVYGTGHAVSDEEGRVIQSRVVGPSMGSCLPDGAPILIALRQREDCEPGTIVAFDRKSGQMETIKIPTPGSIVRNMSVDSTRSRIWLALSGTSRIGKIELK